ncbi:hypothetical protein EGW08_009111 [Elysia chlorotica]|uniref:Dynein heavy chain coiled coil stalk domain-containing protein n=1 Tax=Elysia chlorotica TaxID=188477 RepID=A0A433TNG0_ELYCH|nr:hypothetical protein EGW08_009111 [Elysia chlorotica]
MSPLFIKGEEVEQVDTYKEILCPSITKDVHARRDNIVFGRLGVRHQTCLDAVFSSWENAKLLMADVNFFQQLVFYNKDEIPEDKFKALKQFVFSPNFTPEHVKSKSMAAASICTWVHAVYQYSSIHRKMQPHIKNLLDAENKFTKNYYSVGRFQDWDLTILHAAKQRQCGDISAPAPNAADFACLRNILNVRWPEVVSCKEVWARAKPIPKKRKWGLIDHTLRKHVSNITRQALECNPQRKKGRTSEADLAAKHRRTDKAAGTTRAELKRTSQNRVRWSRFAAAVCSTRNQEA